MNSQRPFPFNIPYFSTTLLALFLSVFIPSSAFAGTFTTFGPQNYIRSSGSPVAVINDFSVLNPNTTYTLRINNGGLEDDDFELVSSSVFILNGVQIVGPSEFNQNVNVIEKPVTLLSDNVLSVEVRGKPGGGLTVEIIGVDDDPLTITPTIVPPPNAAGWHNQDVTVSFDCTGAVTCQGPIVVQTEGAAQVITGVTTDQAGNSVSINVTVNLDKTAPTINVTSSPLPNTNGWNNSDVTVSFTASDGLSGIDSVTPDTILINDGAAQLVSGTTTDIAGNSASTSISINLDRSPPTLISSLDPLPNLAGWNDIDTTVSFIGNDTLSGLDQVTDPIIVTTEGANQIVNGSATDFAGNQIDLAVTLNIDKTAPVVSITSPLDGFLTTDPQITINGSVSDAGVIQEVSVNGTVVTLVNGSFTFFTTLTEGLNTFNAVGTDVAGNTGQTQISGTFEIAPPPPDTTPPQISIIDPTDGFLTNTPSIAVTGRVVDDVAVQNVTVNGVIASLIDDTFFSAVVSLVEGANTINVVANDTSANQNSVSHIVTLDTIVPVLNIATPTDGSLFAQSPITVTGNVDESNATVSVNGIEATVAGNTYTAAITLTEGTNTVTAQATDTAGNTGQVQVTVTLDSMPPVVSITSPTNLSTFIQPSITVTGTVDDPQATVEVDGIPAVVTSGSFSVSGILIREGTNVITAVSTDLLGHTGTSSIQVILDTISPTITIGSPADGFVTSSSSLTVTGMINDIVIGSVNADQITVTINGINAEISNRSYLATDVPLSPGLNTITAIGTDQAGNSSTSSITVTFEEIQSQPRISLISGNNQSGSISSQLPDPLVIALTDEQGIPVVGQAVKFKVVENDGTVSDGGSGAVRSLDVLTDVQGRAQVSWTLGTRAGFGNHRVEASAIGFVDVATFTASAFAGTPTKIKVESGNNQTGIVDQAIMNPFMTIVTDAGGNRVANIPVTYSVTKGGGKFNGQSDMTVNTDNDGRAFVVLILGPGEGNDNNVVQTTFSGNSGQPAVFVASGRIAGDPVNTAISGVVLDNTNQPVEGVTMQVDGTALETQTDSLGQFVLQPVPVGHVDLIADGTTAQRPGTWPTLHFEFVTISGQNNTLGMPIYLLPLDTANGKLVGGPADVVLEMANVPGLALKVFSNSATCPDGSSQCQSMITQVHRDKVPMPPPGGVAPRLVWTIQPAGIIFDPPAQITYPNVDGHLPGKIVDIFSFDHDLGLFIVVGTGTVSEDGLVITSDPGVGIRKGGWGYVPPPPPDDTCVKNSGQVSVTIEEAPDFLEIGQIGTLSADGTISQAPNCPDETGVGTYTWTSSDQAVADDPPSDQNSSLTAKVAGTTTITVTFTAPSGLSATDSVQLTVGIAKVEFDINKVNERNLNQGTVNKSVALVWDVLQTVDLFSYLTSDSDNINIRWTIINGNANSSSPLNYGPEPAEDRLVIFDIQADHQFCTDPQCSDRMILVIVPRITQTNYNDWFNTESQDTAWLAGLPALYSSLGVNNSDPEPANCDPQRWKNVNPTNSHFHPGASFDIRSEVVPGGYGHQATYNVVGTLIRNGVGAGTADRVSPNFLNPLSIIDHSNEDVWPFIWASQLDSNPVMGNASFLPSNLTAPLMYQGGELNSYLQVRPPIANNRAELTPGTCAP